MKILFSAWRHRYFSKEIVDGLQARGHSVTCVTGIPLDVSRYDVVLYMFMDQNFGKVCQSLSTIPVVGLCLGTDAYLPRQESLKGTACKAVMVNGNLHALQLLHHNPDLREMLVQFPYGIDRRKLLYKERPLPVLRNNKLHDLKLFTVGIQQFAKGLNALLMALQDCPSIDHKSMELHVVGEFVDMYLEQHVRQVSGHVPFKVILHGNQTPWDTYIEQRGCQFYVHSCVAEQNSISTMEALALGYPVFAFPWTFSETVYPNSPVHWYYNGTELGDLMVKYMALGPGSPTNPKAAKEKRRGMEYVDSQFNYDRFIDNIEKTLQGAIGESPKKSPRTGRKA